MQWEKRNATPEKKSRENVFFPRLAVWRRRGVGGKNKIRTGKRGFFSRGNYLQFLYKWKSLCRRSWHPYYWNGTCKGNLAHTIDEYAEVEDLTNVFRCYVGI